MASQQVFDHSEIHGLTGEFRDPTLERRFRIDVLPEWQSRFRTNVAIAAVAVSGLAALDYTTFGPSSEFFGLAAMRLAFLMVALWALLTTFTPDRVDQYDLTVFIFQCACIAGFCLTVRLVEPEGTLPGFIMVTIIAQLYLFVPSRPVPVTMVVFAGCVALIVITLPPGARLTVTHVGQAAALLIFAIAGGLTTLRVAKLQRQRFATRETEHRVLVELEARSEELAAARDEANHANRAKSEFLAHMSHELRAPLNAINGFSEIIKDEMFGPVPPRYRDYAGDIHRSGMLLTALINDILDLSKVEAGKLEMHEEVLTPAAVVEACQRLVKDRAFKAKLDLHPLVPADAPRLRADERLVKQMLLNLLTNAIKFTPEGGEVQVVGRTLPDGAYAIAVEDTGIGIAAEDLSRVLEPYGQVEAARDRNPESTGLGLPLVKKMIELHGGSFSLESTPGQGTVATLVFPHDRVIQDSQPATPLAKAG